MYHNNQHVPQEDQLVKKVQRSLVVAIRWIPTVFFFKLFDFNTRAPRGELLTLIWIPFFFGYLLVKNYNETENPILAFIVFYVPVAWFVLACLGVFTRRMHDIGMSGKVLIILPVLLILAAALNRWINSEFTNTILMATCGFFLLVWFALAVAPGSINANKYGPSPFASASEHAEYQKTLIKQKEAKKMEKQAKAQAKAEAQAQVEAEAQAQAQTQTPDNEPNNK